MKEKPYCILKADIQNLKFSQIKENFQIQCNMVYQREIAIFNKEEQQRLKKMIKKMEKK